MKKRNYSFSVSDTSKEFCIVCYDDPSQQTLAMQLASQLSVPCVTDHDPICKHATYVLCYRQQQLWLLCQQQHSFSPFSIDFTCGRIAYRLQHDTSTRQPLARAVGIKPNIRPTILDISAGFAHDASLLANLGCTMTLLERQPIVWALLNDGLQRARIHGCTWAKRMTLYYSNAQDHYKKLQQQATAQPDVIYYDPMFPKNNKDAKVQKPMQILQALIGNEDTEKDVFSHARQLAKQRVVVKRPQYAKPLFEQTPDLQIMMVKYRFDVYFQ